MPASYSNLISKSSQVPTYALHSILSKNQETGQLPAAPVQTDKPRTGLVSQNSRALASLRVRMTSQPSSEPSAPPAQSLPAGPSPHDTSTPEIGALHLLPASHPNDNHAATRNVRLAAIAHSFGTSKPCRAKLGNNIRPSPYRPPVPATHRFLAWCTPFSTSQQSYRAHILLEDQALALAEINNGVTENTLSTYAAGPLQFTQWCDDRNIPEEFRMPADPFLLACFISSAAGKTSGSCAKNWLNRLAYWHHINLAPWHGDVECVSKVVRSVAKKGTEFKRPPRGPVPLEHLCALRQRLVISRPRDVAFWALALCCFWGCHRLGELTLETKKSFKAIHDVSRSTTISRSQQAGRDVVSLHLPWTKTTGTRDLCPVKALDNHLHINHSPDHNTPFFAYCDGNCWSPTIKTDFLVFISSIF
ncbi:hypothetical protein MIND_00987000 [Mycena indigotica]|uniref:DNA breaking-rejoining enzyme n=1 Tax=Mycena indigotica TaxID=2126181 RepID=A0A8H6W0X4_9AGAR|nr:uncharacterized protein MIND_00987000 [Mycena indigotica]KAF7297528.1 hypothetical protein MIND_00987000 [Mycena indigotica]